MEPRFEKMEEKIKCAVDSISDALVYGSLVKQGCSDTAKKFLKERNQTEFLDTSDCIYEEEFNVSANCVTDYLAWHLGPQRLPLKNLIPMTIGLSMSFCPDFASNLSKF